MFKSNRIANNLTAIICIFIFINTILFCNCLFSVRGCIESVRNGNREDYSMYFANQLDGWARRFPTQVVNI